jgi:Spy/CpxP family protein refolding chaperone
MLKAFSAFLVLALSLLFVADVSAQTRERRRGSRQGGRPNFSRVDMMVFGLTLTDEQKAKVAELKKEYDPKFTENMTKSQGVLTDEQKKARREAAQKARADGKNRKEMQEAIDAAVKLTPEQKKTQEELKKAGEALTKEVQAKVDSILTAEQKEQQKKMREEMQKRRSGNRQVN